MTFFTNHLLKYNYQNITEMFGNVYFISVTQIKTKHETCTIMLLKNSTVVEMVSTLFGE